MGRHQLIPHDLLVLSWLELFWEPFRRRFASRSDSASAKANIRSCSSLFRDRYGHNSIQVLRHMRLYDTTSDSFSMPLPIYICLEC